MILAWILNGVGEAKGDIIREKLTQLKYEPWIKHSIYVKFPHLDDCIIVMEVCHRMNVCSSTPSIHWLKTNP